MWERDRSEDEILLEELIEDSKSIDQESFEECRAFVRRMAKMEGG